MKNLLLLSALSLSITAQAQVQLVKDMNATGGSFPVTYANCYNKLFYTADDGIHGRELWVTDGSPAGTHMVVDFNGSEDGMKNENSSPSYIFTLNGKLFFNARTSSSYLSLLETDGTEAGTKVVKNTAVFYPEVIGSRVYFTGDNGTPWVSDGTEAGTFELIDVEWASNYTAYNGKVYFTAKSTTANTFALWETDGTKEGTIIIKDIKDINTENFNGTSMVVLGAKLLFAADDGTGFTLWTSDGTSAGTAPITTPINNTGNIAFGSLFNGKFYFYNGNGAGSLYETNGTATGTKAIMKLGDMPMYFLQMCVYNDKLIFASHKSTSNIRSRYELWSLNTAGKLNLIRSFNRDVVHHGPSPLTVCNGLLYFKAVDTGRYYRDLWVSDGTTEGTNVIVSAKGDTNAFSNLYEIATMGNTMYFSANFFNAGNELYKMDAPALSVKNTITATQPITIYPNPANNTLNIDLPQAGKCHVSVMSITGQVLLQQDVVDARNTISIATLPPGVYNLQLTTSNEAVTEQFIKQ